MRPRGNSWLVLFASPILAACAAGSSLGDSSNLTGAGGSVGTSTSSSITQSGGNGTSSGGTGGSSGSFTTTGSATGGGTSTGTNSGGGSGTATSVGGASGTGTAAGGGSGTSAGGGSGTSAGGGASTSSSAASTAASTTTTVASTVASTGASSSTGGSCAGQTTSAQLVPLDLYIMQDRSTSMYDFTGSGGSKWTDVTKALKAFINDPTNAGLGVGIQYFPQPNPAWYTCTTNAQCPGTTGPCWTKTCADGNYNTYCTTNAQCFPYKCASIGFCSGDPGYICDAVGQSCGTDPAGNALGTCTANNAANPSFCVANTATSADLCTTNAYSTPAVEIATLPGNANLLVNSINSTSPLGATPTSAALQGALAHASTWANAHAGHKVVVVLATDGTPTECDTVITDIQQLASGALNGTPSVSTFVIGVFAPNDPTGQANCNAMANAGGTGQAFIIDTTTGSVNAQFQAALQAIRGQQLPCTFQIPQPASGSIDYGKVNVIYTDGGGTKTTIYYTSNLAGCDPSAGGWYYDVDPTTGGTPTQIVMCPKSCTQLQSGGSVDIEVGCTTIIKPGG